MTGPGCVRPAAALQVPVRLSLRFVEGRCGSRDDTASVDPLEGDEQAGDGGRCLRLPPAVAGCNGRFRRGAARPVQVRFRAFTSAAVRGL